MDNKKQDTILIKFNYQYPKFKLDADNQIKFILDYNLEDELNKLSMEQGESAEESKRLKSANSSKWNLVRCMQYLDNKYKRNDAFYQPNEVVELPKELANHYLSLNLGGAYEVSVPVFDEQSNITKYKKETKQHKQHIDEDLREVSNYYDPMKKGDAKRYDREYEPVMIAERV